MDVPESPRRESLKVRAIRAGSWVLISHVFMQAFRLGGNLVLTRLLSPDVFGTMAIATVFQVVISLLAETGLFQSVIQSPNAEDRKFLDTAWTVQILRGCWIWFACVALAGALYVADKWEWLPSNSVYATANLPQVIVALSLSSVINGFRSTKAIVVYRNLNVSRVILIEIVSSVIGLAVALLLAWRTRSIWSLVVSGLVASVLSTVLSHVLLEGPIDRFAWDRRALQELLNFGRWIFLSSAVGVLAGNGDRLLLGGWFTPAILGYYSIALNLTNALEAAADRLLSSVSLATLSEVARRDPSHLRTLYFRMRWPIDAAFLGMAGFLFASGEWIIHLLYDVRYVPAGWMLKMLSFGLVFARYGLVQNAYLALGQPNYLAVTNVVKTASLFILVPAFYYGFGIGGAIMGIALYRAPTLPFIFYFNERLNLNNILLELAVLAFWPLGWLAGLAMVAMVHR